MRGQEEEAEAALPGDGEVIVKRIFSPDVRRIVPRPLAAEPEEKQTAKAARVTEATQAKLDERLGLKRKELRKVVKPLQPGSPSKMLPAPTKVRAQMERERQEATEEEAKAVRNEGKKFANYSDRFEEEHEQNRRKSKDRRNAIAKAKRTRTHRVVLRTSKGGL